MDFKLTDMPEALLSFLRLLGFYPRGVQIVFLFTAIMFVLSLVLGLYFYSQACDQRDQILTEKGIAIDLSIMTPEPILPPASNSPLTLTYVNETIGALDISPKLGYLERFLKGEPIYDLFYWRCPFVWDFPNLDIKVVNNSPNTILLIEARLNVKESIPESKPLLLIKADRLQSHARNFDLRNEGWSDVIGCSGTYGVVPWRESWKQIADAMQAEVELPSARHEISIGAFSTSVSVNVSAGFEAAGVDLPAVDALLSQTDEKMTEEEWNDKIAKALGPFEEAAGLVYGTLVYSWNDAAGNPVDKQVRFFTRVFIANENRRGLPRPPSAQYNALLEVSKRDYNVNVPLSQQLKPNDADRFTIRLGAAQTSFHRLALQLIYNDRRALAPVPFSIQIFVPRSGSKKQIETTGPDKQSKT